MPLFFRPHWSVCLILATSLATIAEAGAMVHHIEFVTPRVGQRGTTVDVELEGTFIKDTREVLFYKPGIKCIAIKPQPSLPEPKGSGLPHGGYVQDSVICTFQIAPDCPLGLHPFKLRTAHELTMLSTFAVTAFAIFDEAEPGQGRNDTLKTALEIKPNTTVRGSIRNSQAADIDLYKVSAKAGQHLSVEVDAVWLSERYYGGAEYDLMARILDGDGKELAVNDDSALHLQDPIISSIVPRDGDYFVEIKQRVYNGNSNYIAHIGTNARPLAIYPAGGPAGKALPVTLLGDPAGEKPTTLTLPSTEGNFAFNEAMPSPLPMRVSLYENQLEDRSAEVTLVKTLPIALNGIIEQPGDEDTFRITAKKGDRWRVRVYARSLGTTLDPRIAIRRVGSENIDLEGDDATLEERGFHGMSGQIQRKEKMDPSLIWEPKEDGDYTLSITDMRGLGDALSVYRIEIEPVRDEISTSIAARVIDSVECPRLTSIGVAPGNRWNVNINLSEGQGNRYKGDLDIVATGLPPGVQMIASRIIAGAKQAQAQFIAGPEVKPQVGLITLQCQTTDGTSLVSRSQQSFPFVNRSGGHAWHTVVVDQYAFAITDPAPYTVELVQPPIPLSQQSELAVQLKFTRQPGFNEALEFQCDWLPPGVEGEPTVTIPEGKNESLMHLTADANAKPGTWKLAVTASTTGGSYYLGVGRIRTATNFIDLIIAEPYVVLKNHPAAVRRGATAQIEWDVEQKKPFTGEAEAILLGLPKGVTVTANLKLKLTDTKLIFEIIATSEALMGQYKELTCELVFKASGQEIRQRSGKGILRVDPMMTAKSDASQ